MGRHCELCKVYLPSVQAEEQHEKGKKHQQMLAVRLYRTELAARSAFLYGFPAQSLGKVQLLDFFAHAFGNVSDVCVDSLKGTFAIVEFTDVATAERARAAKKLHIGGHAVVITERKVDFDTAADQCSIKFDADAALQQFRTQLPMCHTADQLYTALVNLLQVDDLDARFAAVSRLEAELTTFFPETAGITVQVFGSCVTGLATHGCDMDLTLITGVPHVNAEKNGEKSYLLRSNQFLLSGDPAELCGDKRITVDELTQLSRSERVKFVSRALNFLRKSRQLPVSCQVSNTQARCPLVKFVWAKHYQCDLSVDNRLALNNAQWLKRFCECDVRVRPLLMAIRFWAQVVAGVGKAEKGHDITSYAVTLLVVVFLQKKAVMPAINSRKEGETAVLDGWTVGFPNEWSFATDAPVDELFKDFILFYSSVCFKDVVICPFAGQILALDDFKNELEVPHADPRIKKNFKLSFMNVQDPFVLDHNTASYPSSRLVQKFERKLAVAAKLLSSSGSDGDVPALKLLFAPPTKKDGQKSVTPTSTEGHFRLSLSASMEQLGSIASSLGGVVSMAPIVWQQRAHDAVCKVMEQLLRVSAHASQLRRDGVENGKDEDDDSGAPSAKRFRGDMNIGAVHEQRTPRRYSTRYRLWQGRRAVKRQLMREQPNLGDFATELEVTERLLRKAMAESELVFVVSFAEDEEESGDLAAADTTPTPHLELLFEHREGSVFDFKNLVHFLETCLNKLVVGLI